jgi:hypothetical protein
MLRLLYKTLLISVLSGSLSIMNMTAFAQETAPTTSSNMQKAKAPEGMTRDSNGVYKKTDTMKFDKIEDKDMIASITMLATGFIAARLYMKYKPVTTDMTVAAIGGAAFIAGEVMSNMSFKKKMDDATIAITKSSDGAKDQAQIDRLNDLKKSYEEAKKTTGTKKMLQLAAAAAFAGAAAIAGYLNYQEYVAFGDCMLAVKAASACGLPAANLTALMTQLDAARQKPGPTAINGASVNSIKELVEANMASLPGGCAAAPPPIVAATEAAGANAIRACQSAIAIETINQTIKMTPSSPADLSSTNLNNILKRYENHSNEFLEKFKPSPFLIFTAKIADLLFPRADAGWLPLLGLAGGAMIGVFGATYLGLAVETDYFMLSPFNRVIAWGSLGALSFLASKASQSQIDKIDENIKKIDKILAELNALQAGIKSNNVSEQQIKLAGFNSNISTDMPLNTNPNVKTDCIAGKDTNGCTPLSGQIASMPGFANLPDSFKSIASQSAKLGDGLSGTNVVSGSTLSSAANLANKANAISNLNKSVQSKLNDFLAKNGKPKIDFAKEENNFLNRLNGATSKALNSKGMSASGFLASTGISPLSSSKAVDKPVTTAMKKINGQGSGSASGSAVSPKKDKDFELDFKEAGGGDSGVAGAAAPVKEAQYDIGQNDINTNSGESIFQMISNRYFKSGYPKLLEEDAPVKK